MQHRDLRWLLKKSFACHCERSEAISDFGINGLEIASSATAPRKDSFSDFFSNLLNLGDTYFPNSLNLAFI